MHEGNGFGAGVGVALLGERDVGVEARVVGTGDVGVGLGLEVGGGEGGYVDECEGWESPVLGLVWGSASKRVIATINSRKYKGWLDVGDEKR